MPRKSDQTKNIIDKSIRSQVGKINRRFRFLEKAGEYGNFKAQKDLIAFAKDNPDLKLTKEKGTNKHTLTYQPSDKSNMANLRLIKRRLDKSLESRTFSVREIRKMRKETRESLRTTLSGVVSRDITDKDLDRFYELAEYSKEERENSITEQLDPSDMFILIDVAKENKSSKNDWLKLVRNYADIKSEYMRNQAEELYNKYVR